MPDYIPPSDAEFEGSDANKTVHFPDFVSLAPLSGIFDIGRWQNSRGEKGPLSETVSATVPG